jgi:hypothetical protein
MSSLVERLSNGEHAVTLVRYKSTAELEEAVERGFVLVKFTETKGGTELGFKIDQEQSRTAFSSGEKIRLVGPLTLDYVEVTCVVEIDAKSLTGTGGLVLREPAAGSAERSGTSDVSAEADKFTEPAPKKDAQKKKARSKSNRKTKVH